MKKILYIHGLNCSSTIFNFIKYSLPDHHSISVDYISNNKINTSLDFIEKFIPDEEFSIVGHSLGGILASLISIRKLSNVKLDKVVTISSPFGGSGVAGMLKWIYPQHAILKDISPDSKIIKEISSNKIKSPMISIISTKGHLPLIPYQNDGVVTIKSQLMSPTNKKYYIDCNHFEIVQDIRTVETIKSFLWS